MVLVDTSVWVALFRSRRTEAASRLRRMLDDERPFAIMPVIMQELMQGAADERDFALLDQYLTGQTMLLPFHPVDSHRRAARIYFDCRRRGFTPRSTIDCLIAQVAVEHGVPLLHNDRDYERIAQVVPDLEFA